MALTVAEARTRARSYVLDDDGTRWPDAEMKQHLQFALDGVHNEYITAGGDAFDAYVESISSSAGGIIDLSAYNVAQIDGLNLVQGGRHYPIHNADLSDREFQDDQVRTFSFQYKRGVQIGDADGDPLVSTDGTTQANSWLDYEQLVCLRAAMVACMKDGFIPPALREEEQRMLGRVMKRAKKPRAKRLRGNSGYYTRWLRYDFNDAGSEILIHRKLG